MLHIVGNDLDECASLVLLNIRIALSIINGRGKICKDIKCRIKCG